MSRCMKIIGSGLGLALLMLAGWGDEAPAGKTVRQTVYYSGQVQGVGFRATTKEIARHYQVTGWVKNLDDGRVQLVVEGDTEVVKDFLEKVTRHFKENITKQEVEAGKATGEFQGFEVRR